MKSTALPGFGSVVVSAILVILVAGPGSGVSRAQDREQWRGFNLGYGAVQRGASRLARGDREEGLAEIAEGRKILEQNILDFPEYGPNHYGLALAYFATEESDAAEAELVECLRKQEDYGPARHRLIRHRLDCGRVGDALEVLDWFRADAPRFDEQVDHFRAAAIAFERLGRHGRAFECALEAWKRDITKWSTGEAEEGVEPVLAKTSRGELRPVSVDDPVVRETIWLLAVNASVDFRGEAGEWVEVLRALPDVAERGLPFGFRMLDLARRFCTGGETFILDELPRHFAGEDSDRTLRFVLSVTDRELSGIACEEPVVRAPKGASRAWSVYFRRRLGDRLLEWDESVSTLLPAALDEKADACHEDDPAAAADFAVLAGRLRGSTTGDRWLFIAQARFDAREYERAIDALDRGLAAKTKPRFPYKFERLRQRCLREQRRHGTDR